VPIVVKTPLGFSSTGVFICETIEEARTAVESIVGKIGPDVRHTQQALLEEYIEGREFAVNLMVSLEKTPFV
jgi:phosphoribosylamine-glycine ligase